MLWCDAVLRVAYCSIEGYECSSSPLIYARALSIDLRSSSLEHPASSRVGDCASNNKQANKQTNKESAAPLFRRWQRFQRGRESCYCVCRLRTMETSHCVQAEHNSGCGFAIVCHCLPLSAADKHGPDCSFLCRASVDANIIAVLQYCSITVLMYQCNNAIMQ